MRFHNNISCYLIENFPVCPFHIRFICLRLFFSPLVIFFLQRRWKQVYIFDDGTEQGA